MEAYAGTPAPGEPHHWAASAMGIVKGNRYRKKFCGHDR